MGDNAKRYTHLKSATCKRTTGVIIKKFLILITIMTIWSPIVKSDALISFSMNEGYNSNLFNDSFSISDSYTTFSTDVAIYPTEMMEINVYGDYNLYKQTSNLSSFMGGASFSFIPSTSTMISQVIFNGSLSYLSYGADFSPYNNMVISGSGSWSYQLRKKVVSKIGLGASSKRYTNTSSVTDNLYYAYGRLLATVWSQNAISFETAFYSKKFSTDDSFNSNNRYIDLSFRYSRPIGNSIGLQIFYLKRLFEDSNDAFIPGYTIDYLSPWYSLWGGDEISVSIKKIFQNQVVVYLRGAYSEKSYIKQRESDLTIIPQFTIFARDDITRSISIELERKYFTGKSLIIPRIIFRYLDNNSSLKLYSYEKISLYGSISLGF